MTRLKAGFETVLAIATMLALCFVMHPVFAQVAQLKVKATLTCIAPTAYTDNTPITVGTPITFKLYGSAPEQPLELLNAGKSTCNFTHTGIQGAFGFVVTATVNNVESDASARVTVNDVLIPPPEPKKPNAPTGVKISSAYPIKSASAS